MLNLSKDFRSLTDFKRRTSELVEQPRKTKRAIVFTVNDRPAVVAQDAEGYQRLLDPLEQWECGTCNAEGDDRAAGARA